MSEFQQKLNVRITDDMESVVIEYPLTNGISGSITITLAELTGLIRGLGRVRRRMVTGRPVPHLEGERVDTVFQTRWFIQPEPLTEGSSVGFYHPAFGPVGFVIPKAQVGEVIRILTAHLGIQSSVEGKPN